MLRRIAIWRLVGKAMAYMLLLLVVVVTAGYTVLSLLLDKPVVRNPVKSLPPGIGLETNLPSYAGPHPRFVDRVRDTFDYPVRVGEVGPHEPLYAGPLQYPFYCRTEESGLGQPLIDNQHQIGVPVFKVVNERKSGQVVGYSKDCLIKTRVHYYYFSSKKQAFREFSDEVDDIELIELDGEAMEYIVRVETGSINRFIYMLAALVPKRRALDSNVKDTVRADRSLWNGRLIYQFRGGVGIGKVQGRLSITGLLGRRDEQLRQGYGVAYSTGNQTSNHYNVWLAEETALRVKRQFIARYGEPLYTVGIGGSGGAIQQYLIAQNLPGLLDAAIPLYSYPDMISQTTYVFDCELLEYYFDVRASDNKRWRNWRARQRVAGLNAAEGQYGIRGLLYDIALFSLQRTPHFSSGSNECVEAWRGLTSLVNNPRYLFHAGRYSQAVLDRTHWSYWDDMKYVLGTNQYGYANQTWDNVGVQYGLDALREGAITPKEFVHLNANIGSWKPAMEMVSEQFWKLGGIGGITGLLNFSPWGQQNMRLSPDGGTTPAPRGEADIDAIQAAYRSGQVFVGFANIPIIDLRHYLDDQLDMHHSFASLSVRRRMIEGQGSASNQLIWMARRPHEPIAEAFELLDRWMIRLRSDQDLSVADARPDDAVDRCYDASGNVIGEGAQVWDGVWNAKEKGDCTEAYPFYRESRMVAGAPVNGSVFKCHLQSIETAMEEGIYEPIDMRPYLTSLQRIFPSGVCDYRKGDLGRPDDLLEPPSLDVPFGDLSIPVDEYKKTGG